MWHAYGNANGDAHIHSDGNCDGNGHIHSDSNCHIHANSDSDIYCNGYGNSHSYSNDYCDRTAAAYTDATATADAAAAYGQLL